MKKNSYKSLLVFLCFSMTLIGYSQVQQTWVSTYNGPSNWQDQPYGIAADASGNVYVLGGDNSVGNKILKYSKDGALLWNAGAVGGKAIALDNLGNVYVTGGSDGDFVTFKFNSAGENKWYQEYPFNGPYGGATAIAIDGSGNVYITGRAYDGTDIESSDYATIKYNSAGTRQWVRTYNGAEPGTGADGASSIAVDPFGNVYVTGTSQLNGKRDIATLKYSPTGTVLWEMRYNGVNDQDDFGGKVMLDAFGNVYVSGTSETTEDRPSNDFNSVISVVKYTFSGFQLWVNQFTPPEFTTHNHFRDMEIDGSGNIIIASFHEINAPGTLDLTKLNINGVKQWTKTTTNPFVEGRGSYIAKDNFNNIYVTGLSYNTTTGERFLTVLKYDTYGNQLWRHDIAGRRAGDDAKRGFIDLDPDANVYVTFIYDGGSVRHDDIAVVRLSQCNITCPSNITVNNDAGKCSAVVLFSPATYTGDCGSSFTYSHDTGIEFPIGITTVTVTSDETGATCSFTITVVDNENPIITNYPASKSVNTNPGVCYATASSVNAGTATATDNCNVTVAGVRSDGQALTANYPPGVTTITWTATDASNNTATCTQTITVLDNIPPVISNASVSKSVLSPPNHKMVDVFVDYTVTDNCPNPSIAVTVTSDEPETGLSNGDLGPDIVKINDKHWQLRAERDAKGDGRVYTIMISATDGSGNTDVETKTVVVAHNISSPHSGAAVKVGSTVNFTGTFWDVAGNKHTSKWLIDDKISVTGVVTEPTGLKNGNVAGSYKFTAPSVYKLKMNITDQKGITTSTTTNGDLEAIIVVYDPNGGYTYGGGSFTSPAGGLKTNAAVSGDVSYGFTVNYYKGATTPKGETQFDFKLGDFEYNALNFDYLAISGAKAQFKGTGRIIGGQSGINFIMTVIDGQLDGSGVDKVRMKIYNKNTNEVYYDNQPGASDAADPVAAVGANSTITISNNNAVTQARPEVVKEEITSQFNGVASPNPSRTAFNIRMTSSNIRDRITVKVLDMYGRLLEVKQVFANQQFEMGRNYRPGTYVVQLLQGKEQRQMKLIKAAD